MQMMMQRKVAAVTTEWLIITSGPPTGLGAQVLTRDDHEQEKDNDGDDDGDDNDDDDRLKDENQLHLRLRQNSGKYFIKSSDFLQCPLLKK